MDEGPPPAIEIEAIIRRYLHAHPHAVDTERGIREWWLRDAHGIYRVGDVRAAIRGLVAAGDLVERRLPNGESIYARSVSSSPHNA